MSRIACIALLILLSTHQPLIAKEGDNLIGKPAHEWGKLKMAKFGAAQTQRPESQRQGGF